MITPEHVTEMALDFMRLGIEHALYQLAGCETSQTREAEADRLMAFVTDDPRRMAGLRADIAKGMREWEADDYVPADTDPRPKITVPMDPRKAQGLRDAVALINAIVRGDTAGERAIVQHCDRKATLLSMAAWTAMVAQQAAGLDQEGLLVVTQAWVEEIAAITVDKGASS